MRKIFIVLFILLTASYTYGATWYASTDGSAACGTGCLTGAPCSLTTILTCTVNAGDTVILKNGTYTDSGLIPTRSGSIGNYITIQAETEGLVIIDGQGVREPLRFTTISYNIISGIIFKNAVYDVGKLHSTSQYNKIQRCGFINSGAGNYHLVLLTGSNTAYNLIEDCYSTQGSGAGKNGRYGFIAFNGAHHNTFRRNYMKYLDHSSHTGGPCAPFSVYGASNNLFENNIADLTQMSTACDTYGERAGWYNPALYNTTDDNTFKGNVLWSTSSSPPVNQMAVTGYGDRNGNRDTWIDNVFLYFKYGLSQGSVLDTVYTNNTLVSITTSGLIRIYNDGGSDPTATATNNSLLTAPIGMYRGAGTLTSTYNNFYGITTQYSGTILDKTGDKTLNPVYDTTTYGKGAYLMVPTALVGQGEAGTDIGAKVLYRYVDGVLTGTALWPWPMEDRIVSELGVSVTYETNSGIWKTLTGVYGSDPPDPPPVVEKASMRGGASLSGGASMQ